MQSDAKLIQLKAEVLEEIQTKLVPETVLTNVSSTAVRRSLADS